MSDAPETVPGGIERPVTPAEAEALAERLSGPPITRLNDLERAMGDDPATGLPEQCEECESTGQNCPRHRLPTIQDWAEIRRQRESERVAALDAQSYEESSMSLGDWVRKEREEEKAAERAAMRKEIELEVRRELAGKNTMKINVEPEFDMHKIGDVLEILAGLLARLSGELNKAAVEISSLAPPVKTHEEAVFTEGLIYAQQQASYPTGNAWKLEPKVSPSVQIIDDRRPNYPRDTVDPFEKERWT